MEDFDNRIMDSKKYRDRKDLSVTNANLFISNNANPFLISPYAPPANLVKTNQLVSINIAISSAIANLSSIVDLNTWTLKICTITNSPYYPDVTISTQNIFLNGSQDINIEANNTILLESFNSIDIISPQNTIDGTNNSIIGNVNIISGITTFQSQANFISISTGFLFTSLANISSLNVSSINVSDENINFLTVNSTLNASSMFSNNLSTGNVFASLANISSLNVSSINVSDENINSLTVNSTLNASSIFSNNLSTGNIFGGNIIFQTLQGSIATFSTLTISSLLSVSSLSTTNIVFETLSGNSIISNTLIIHSTLAVSSIYAASSITTQHLVFSSFYMTPANISSFVPPVSTFFSSILISLNGNIWKIPIIAA